MKKIYRISLDWDMGELWLDENKKLLDYVHSNDGEFRKEYHGFIINYLGGKLIDLDLSDFMPESEQENLEECDCGELFYDVIKPFLKKIKQ